MAIYRFFPKEISKQFIKFAIVGISNTFVDIGIFYLLTTYTPIYYILANIISFSAGTVNSYIWNKVWTFRSQNQQISKEFIKFVLVSIIGLILNTLFLSIFIEVVNLPSFLGKILATFLILVWNFLMSKFWAFKDTNKNE